MRRRLRRMAGVLWGVCFFLVVVGQALVLADGPVRLEVDKGAGRPGPALNSPVIAPMPGAAPAGPRQVEPGNPQAVQPSSGGLLRWLANTLVEGLTGADLDQWKKPEKLWFNLGSAVLLLATGAGINDWKNIKNWDALMWAWVIANIILTLASLGVGKLVVKLLGPVGKIAAELVRPIGKLFGPVGRRLVPSLEPTWNVVSRVSRVAATQAREGKLTKIALEYAGKATEWVLSKGLRSLVKWIEPNPFTNPGVKWLMKKFGESALGSRLAESWLGRSGIFVAESWRALRGTIGRMIGDNAIARAIRRVPVGNTTIGVILQRSRLGLREVSEAVARRDPLGFVAKGADKVLSTRRGFAVGAEAGQKRLSTFLKLKGELEAITKGRKRIATLLTYASTSAEWLRQQYAGATRAVRRGLDSATEGMRTGEAGAAEAISRLRDFGRDAGAVITAVGRRAAQLGRDTAAAVVTAALRTAEFGQAAAGTVQSFVRRGVDRITDGVAVAAVLAKTLVQHGDKAANWATEQIRQGLATAVAVTGRLVQQQRKASTWAVEQIRQGLTRAVSVGRRAVERGHKASAGPPEHSHGGFAAAGAVSRRLVEPGQKASGRGVRYTPLLTTAVVAGAGRTATVLQSVAGPLAAISARNVIEMARRRVKSRSRGFVTGVSGFLPGLPDGER